MDQAELMKRMHADVVALCTGVCFGSVSPSEERAIEQVAAWIRETLAHLDHTTASVAELEMVVEQWRSRRAPFLPPQLADVIVVDSRISG